MEQQRGDVTHNFFAFGFDTVTFSIGLLGFMNTSIILPSFVEHLGGSPTEVGLLMTIIGLAWTGPQLIAGNIASRFRRKKPFVLAMALTGRVFVLALAVLIALTKANPPWLSLIGLYLAMILFLGTDGFATIGWMDMLGRAFPPERRGSFISIWQAITSVVILVVTALVGYLLSEQGPGFPTSYAILFGLGGSFFFLSAIGTWSIKEPAPVDDAAHYTPVAWGSLIGHVFEILRQDVRLRRVAIARVFFNIAMMAFAFYEGFAIRFLRLPSESIASFIFAQTIGTIIGSLTLGRIADRYGSQRAVQVGTAVILSAPVLALMLYFRFEGLSQYVSLAYIWIYVCVGLANNLLFLGFANYVLEIAPGHQRTIYTGAVNTINSIGVLAPIFAGWLLDQTSYGLLFGVTIAFGVGALVMAFRLPSPRNA